MAKRSPARTRPPRRPPSAPEDPVTAYAHAVIAKVIIAGLLVRLACQRHLRDLDEQAARGLVWKPDQARLAIAFFETVLCLPDEDEASLADDGEALISDAGEQMRRGKPFLLTPFQKFIVGSLCGWFTAQGYTRFRIGYIETGKGSGKTPLAAGILLLRLAVLPGVGKQMYIAATMRDQAMLTFTDAVNMVEASPALKSLLNVQARSISNDATRSFIKAVSAEDKGLDGKRVDGAVGDEVHEHPSNVVVEKMRAGIKNRRNALIMLTTNSGYDRTSVCWELHEYARQVLEGTIANDEFFGYVCQLDPCEACYAKGVRAPDEKCPDCDQWFLEGPHWLKANPNLEVSLPWDYLRGQVREALGMPTKRALVMRLNFCLWTAQYAIWIPRDEWDACQVDALPDGNPTKDPAVASLDLSVKFDLSACVIGVRHDDVDATGEQLEISGTDPETGEAYSRRIDLDFTIDLYPFFWMPEDTLHERVQKDRIPFDVWKRQGFLETTKGPIVDYMVIYDKLTKDLVKRFHLRQIGYDQYNATHIGSKLRDEARLTTVELKQGKFLSEAAKTVHALARVKRLRHHGNAVLGWCFANAQAKEDRFENIWLEKASKVQRIDGATATCGVVYQLMNMPRPRKRTRSIARVFVPGQGFGPVPGSTQPDAQ